MYCSECGAKNKKTDAFCSECGHPLMQEDEKQEVTTKVVKDKKPMSKKNKIIIGIITGIVLLLGIGYKVGSDMSSPKKVADEYIKDVISGDGNKLYKYLELEGDKTFVSKKIFADLVGDSNSNTAIENYKITDVEYGDGKLTATVKFSYTSKTSSSEKTSSIKLVKESKKKFIVFDSWKINDSSVTAATVKDYTIKVIKGSKLTFAGIEVKSKYLNKDESNSKYDVYDLPLVFSTKTELKVVLPSGMEIKEIVTPSAYYNLHEVSLDENTLSTSEKEKIVSKAKESLTTIYTNAIEQKEFSSFKSNLEHGSLDLSKLESSYNSFLSDLKEATNTLTSITFKDVSIYDLDITNDGYLEVEVKANYDYTVKYTNFNNEEKENSSSSYEYMKLTYAYDKGEYYLVNVSDLEDYFSRY